MTSQPRTSPTSLRPLALVLLGGCALFSRSETLQVRYFTLEPTQTTSTATSVRAPSEPPLALRLGRIDAGDGLTQDLVVRTGANEITYREDERWTERPTQYVRRGLERELFQKQSLMRVYSGAAPTLDVELVELEIALLPAPKARVRLLSHLHDQRRGLCDDTSAFEQAIAPGTTEQGQVTQEAVAALARAMQEAIAHLAERTLRCLADNHVPPAAETTAQPRPGT